MLSGICFTMNMFVLVFVQVRHQVDLLDLGKGGVIKFQIKELFIGMYCQL